MALPCLKSGLQEFSEPLAIRERRAWLLVSAARRRETQLSRASAASHLGTFRQLMTSAAPSCRNNTTTQQGWVDRDLSFVARRYDCIAAFIPIFDWIFFLPSHL